MTRTFPMARMVAGHDPKSYAAQTKPIGVGAALPDRTHHPDIEMRHVRAEKSHYPMRSALRELSRNGTCITYELECGHRVLRFRAMSGTTGCRTCSREVDDGASD